MRLLLSFLLTLVLSVNVFPQEGTVINDRNIKVQKPLERMKYFNSQRAYPNKEIPDGKLIKAVNDMNRMIYGKNNTAFVQAQQPEWRCIGPFDTGGRIKSIVHHPTLDNVVYAAAAAGGIWKTTDGGGNWTPIFDFENSIAFGSISIDANNPDIIYAGTGEAVVGGGNVYLGSGMYKTTNGGATWYILGLTNVGAFSKVYVHPKNSDIVYAGAVMQNKGFYRSFDAGKTWERTFEGNISDVTINPENENEVYIAYQANGILYSSDKGTTWESRSVGIDKSNSINRISVQLAPSEPTTLYALVESNYSTETNNFIEAPIYSSTNKGLVWKLIYKGVNSFFNGQGYYDNYIAVHPKAPGFVCAGGIDIFRTNNGGNFSNLTYGYSGGNVHVDQHCLAYSPFDNGTMYAGNDGGIYKTTNGGGTWVAVNNGLEVTQFYAMAIDNSTENRNYGGTQDNGTLGNYSSPASWQSIAGGDGFRVIVDLDNPKIVYGELYYGRIWKCNLETKVTKTAVNGIPTSDVGLWNSPFIGDPTYSEVFYHGRANFYVSMDKCNSWSSYGKLSNEEGAKFTAIAVDRKNSGIIYAGNNVGELFVSKNYGETFADISDKGLIKRYITDIEPSPHKEGTVYVTFSGYGAMNVYKSTDTGDSWKNIGANLPDVPVNAIAIHPLNENYLFIATDIGVFASFNGGESWYPYGRNLPRSPCLDVAFRTNLVDFPAIVLRVATFGRSMWEIDAPNEIITDPSIIIPAGGEIFVSGTNQPISWYGFTLPVEVSYSTDDGVTWTVIASGVSSNSLSWNVPSRPSFTARIKIRGSNNTEVVSNEFTIQLKEKGSILKLNGVTFVPYGIAYDGNNSLYTTSFYGNKLYKLNSETFELEQVFTLEGDSLFTDLTFDKVNKILYIHKMNNSDGGGGKIIVTGSDGKKIREFDSPGKTYPIGLELVDGKLIVGDRDKVDYLYRRLFWVVDPQTGAVLEEVTNPYNQTYGPRGLCYDGSRFLYQICTFFPVSGQALTEALAIRIDKNNLTVAYDTLELTGYNGIINARGVDYDPRDKNIWLTDFGGNLYKMAGFETVVGVEDEIRTGFVNTINAEVFPNPATEFFEVTFNSLTNGFLQVELVNLLGVCLGEYFTGNIGTGDFKSLTVNCDNLAGGAYYLRFTIDNKQVMLKKLVVVK